MPNHLHVLLQLKEHHPLEDVMHSIKSFTAKKINQALNRRGPLWQERYWDRLIRSEKHLDWTRKYIQKNPTKLREGNFILWQK